MRKTLLCGVFAAGCVALAARPASSADLAVMPAPAGLVAGTGTLAIGPVLDIAWTTPPTPLLQRAGARALSDLARIVGLPRQPGTQPVSLRIAVSADPAFLSVGEREHYRLAVDAAGIRLDADGPAGVLDGLSTLLQLVSVGAHGAEIPFVAIDDRPRFKWRGLMIDTARHFIQPATILRTLDAMERVKLDVLHLHLSDAQGFRVKSTLFPRLTRMSSNGAFYTQAQIREIVAYAADRGIRVVPEFDLPGHALSLLQAYPALAAQPIDRAGQDANPDSFAIDPTLPASLKLVAALYGEMSRLFPDRYFHAGGDEVRPEQWTGNPRIAAYMTAHHVAGPAALQGWFTGEVAKMLARDGKTMIGWDEVLAAPVPRQVVVDVWRSSKWMAAAARAGHPVIVSAGYYLDLLQPVSQLYLVDPLDPRAVGLDETQAGIARGVDRPTVDDFARDPQAVLPPEDAHLVLGGEAALWGESVTDEMFEARSFPSVIAVAERLWSPADRRDVADMERRLYATQDRLSLLGLDAKAAQRRMIERIAPGDTAPVETLLGAAVPVRNYAYNVSQDRSLDTPVATLTGLAAIAAPDSEAADRFADLVRRFRAGDGSLEAPIRARLACWRDNDIDFTRAAASHAALVPGLVASHRLAALAEAGLAALDALDGHARPGWQEQARVIVASLRADIAASADTASSHAHPQPAGDLLLPGVEPVADLVALAGSSTAHARVAPPVH